MGSKRGHRFVRILSPFRGAEGCYWAFTKAGEASGQSKVVILGLLYNAGIGCFK